MRTIASALILLGAMALDAGTVATAQQPPAQSAPAAGPGGATTRPAAPVVPVDPSTPRGTLKSLIVSTDAGDSETIRSLMLATSPMEQRMVDAIATRAEVERGFRTAAENAFGRQGMLLLVPDTSALTSESLARLDVARETVNGDTAQVIGVDDAPDSELILKRVNGDWKIPVSQFSRGSDNDVQTRLDDEKLAVSLIREVTEEVAAGRFKTAEEAGEAIRVKIMVATAQRAAAATQATTQPGDPSPPPGTPSPAGTQPR